MPTKTNDTPAISPEATENTEHLANGETIDFKEVAAKLQDLQFGAFRYREAQALRVITEEDDTLTLYRLAPYGLSRSEEHDRWAYKLTVAVESEDDRDALEVLGNYQVMGSGDGKFASFDRIVGEREGHNTRKRESIERGTEDYENIAQILSMLTSSEEYDDYMAIVETNKAKRHKRLHRRIGRTLMRRGR